MTALRCCASRFGTCRSLLLAHSPLRPAHHWGRTRMRTAAASRAGPAAETQACAGTAAAAAGTTTTAPDLRASVWDVGGLATEVLELPATSTGGPEVQLLVIPGNPGAASFYVPFMRALHDRLRGRATVLAVSNLGMVRGAGGQGGCAGRWLLQESSHALPAIVPGPEARRPARPCPSLPVPACLPRPQKRGCRIAAS